MHIKYLYNFLGIRHIPTRPYPLGTYGTSTPHLRRSLDTFGSWSRHLGGLSPPPTVKILATTRCGRNTA